jgi:hypothetical protein
VLTRKTLLTQLEPVDLELDQLHRRLFDMTHHSLLQQTPLTELATRSQDGVMVLQYLQQARDIQPLALLPLRLL